MRIASPLARSAVFHVRAVTLGATGSRAARALRASACVASYEASATLTLKYPSDTLCGHWFDYNGAKEHAY